MNSRRLRSFCLLAAGACCAAGAHAQAPASAQRKPLPDAVQEAQSSRKVPETRPEQAKTEHDKSTIFSASSAPDASTALKQQPDEGEIRGFDLSRDPLNAKKPMQTAEEIEKADRDAKDGIMAQQRRLLESRYNLAPKFDPNVKMSRGKLLPVGPRRGWPMA